MASKNDEVIVVWIKLRGSNCPAYPVRTRVSQIPIFLRQLDPGDSLQISRPLEGE